MLATRLAHSLATVLKALAAIFCLLLLVFSYDRLHGASSSQVLSNRLQLNGNLAAADFPPELNRFWISFADSLVKARPTRFEPDNHNKQRVDFLKLSAEDRQAVKDSHSFMVKQALHQAPDLFYIRTTKGIVTTAGPRYMPILLVSLRMLRRGGSELPVEVFLGSWDEYNSTICEGIFPSLGASCRVLDGIYNKAPSIAKPERFQFKILAILFSSFEDVLFLDADAFPGNKPDDLFLTDPYSSYGLVTWPDIFGNTASPLYFQIASISEPPVSLRLSSESGQLLLSKSKHAADLLLMPYYNYYGPDYYYPLLCQGSHGAGDKETFIHAAMALDRPFWDVRERPWVLGHWKNGQFCLVAMAQHHPGDDWKIQKGLNESSDPTTARPLFVHNHFHKLDPKTIIREDGPTRDVDGNYQRMWGPKKTVLDRFGHDVEQEVWEEILASRCEAGTDTCSKSKTTIIACIRMATATRSSNYCVWMHLLPH
ncbi:mannosyltransferase putative-domain-containing protein [Lipomyces kononenkoae]|uniref:Mannosyltransferase putative-domain-containing protein n=1 Tax=Lipomyces kononenkoae TaxID=34357 RepID=A0ACC3SYH4_LIPKO